MSAAAVGAAGRSPAGAVPGEVLEQLVALVVGEIGESAAPTEVLKTAG